MSFAAKVIKDSWLMYIKSLKTLFCTNALDEKSYVESAM
jgi:hypothetical protein